ncbi:protein RER1 isoform X1 [Macrosteles quadrilineatus]|uniref:protein RER1 isoform X1 n=1 Tax=Macrosteles quadrilineatus TaxID=74068 RepID=UPI0023E0F007|nr:protein RER1 isoform X1 [Macrosteles quadrilineatus]
MMHDDTSGVTNSRGNIVSQAWKHFQQRYQKMLDDVTPFLTGRWIGAVVLVIIFLGRIFILQGWYIVTYALGIYHLNLFIAFLSPKIDPAISDYEDDGGPELPTRANEEFRPFIRRLPEFKFWYSVTKSTVIATICTFFDCFNIPVFWPILVMYFITLFGITMKRQIKHMIKYRYLPFTHGKPKYQGVSDTGKSEATSMTSLASLQSEESVTVYEKT